jgi:hypothetical protein
MQSRVCLSIVLAFALLAAFGLGYRTGYNNQASKRVVILERDAADTRAGGAAQAGYEPYFNKANPLPKLK